MMPDDVAAAVAQRIVTISASWRKRSARITSSVERQPISMELAKAALGDAPPQVVGEPTIQNIIAAVTEFYTIRLADLQSKHRQRSIALPRQVCMYLARKCPPLPRGDQRLLRRAGPHHCHACPADHRRQAVRGR